MHFRIISALVLLIITIWLLRVFHILWDPLLVCLLFLCFVIRGYFFPLAGIYTSIIFDHLLHESYPFYTIAGILIFGSTIWLKTSYPLVRKPLSVIMVPIYSQFLWFMLLFGYYINEGKGAVGAGYFAPFLVGNIIVTACFAVIFFGLLPERRKRDISRELLSRQV